MLEEDHMLEWEEPDCYSFDDSERFEEDSLCSWISEPEGSCNNWRGWKKPGSIGGYQISKTNSDRNSGVLLLVELAAKQVAQHIPFELVEHVFPPVPEQLQLRITFWSFPNNEEDIRLYSCLANGSAEEYFRGEHLFKAKSVSNSLQIGFHLCATVIPHPNTVDKIENYNVAVTFDRGRITSCHCTCMSLASWCAHVVAVCLHRIHTSSEVCLRAPVSESLSRLQRDQLQKFSQYLISELPQQILPTAQRLLDELLSCQQSAINTLCGAPDPTAGASVHEQTSWCLDESALHDNVRKILSKFCVPSPMVFSDVNYLSSTAPPVSAEWTSLLRPLRGREPEGMWNLLSIVREMFRRRDKNAVLLLQIITEECLACEQVLIWWFNAKMTVHTNGITYNSKNGINSNSHTSQHACASLCDEIVQLWRLASLNPALSPQESNLLEARLKTWHLSILEKLNKSKSVNLAGERKSDIEMFPGFKLAIEACLLDWSNYSIPGITFSSQSALFENSLCLRQSETHRLQCQSNAVNRHNSFQYQNTDSQNHTPIPHVCTTYECRRSSLSSEGFCENDGDRSLQNTVVGELAMIGSVPNTEIWSKSDLDPDSDWSSAPETNHLINSPTPSISLYPQQLGDEFQIYYIDTASQSINLNTVSSTQAFKKNDDTFCLIVKKMENPLDILFARAEALHAHGHNSEACKLSVKLAEELLANPPNLLIEAPMQNVGKKRKKVNPASHTMSLLASATLSKIAFLCTVLAESSEYHFLAFQVGLCGLELPRSPASTKFLEVKLANQESDLVVLLKKIPISQKELQIIRNKAQQLRDGTFHSRGEALLPLMLASYILDALVLGGNNRSCSRLSSDEQLGFEATVSALHLKANVSEAEHPLLCEGTRRQRGEIITTLLVHYKDDKEKLAIIMDKVLDKDMHQLYRDKLPKSSSLNANLYNNKSTISTDTIEFKVSSNEFDKMESAMLGLSIQDKSGKLKHRSRSDSFSCDGNKDWETKLRCANLKTPKRHSNPMASIDSSAPETTSSDNSPTLVRRNPWSKLSGPDSDSGSSGHSSNNSPGSHNSSDRVRSSKNCETSTLLQNCNNDITHATIRTNMVMNKVSRFKGKRIYPTIPNQPSEATAYFMFEMANTILKKAGATSATSLFTQPNTSQNPRSPHRALHMCAFQIGLYALGLHNCVSPNWLSRTYSSHVSWITGQALEIGAPALSFLIDTWPGHLTPSEVASLSDRASRLRDHRMVCAAAELALSCLPQSHALNPSEIQRAIQQCKEQGENYLESACIIVEKAAKGDGVSPEVLFHVAKCWHEMYENHCCHSGNNDVNLSTKDATVDSTHYETSGISSPFYSTIAENSYSNEYLTLPTQTTIPCSQFQLAFSYSPFNLTYPVILPPVHFQNQGQYMPFSFPPNVFQSVPQQLHLFGRPSIPNSSGQNTIFAGFSPLNPILISSRPSTIVVTTPQSSSVLSSANNSTSSAGNNRSQRSNYLQHAYRVGMLAMEALNRRVHDDRSQQRYARNPPYGDDVKWLLGIAKILGAPCLNQFCICSMNSIVSPFILQEIASEVANYTVNVNGIVQNFRTAVLPQLIQRCQQMFIQCIHQRLYHIPPAEYDEFVSILVAARAAFHMAVAYNVMPVTQFSELLHSLKRSKSCKKDLWLKIEATLPDDCRLQQQNHLSLIAANDAICANCPRNFCRR